MSAEIPENLRYTSSHEWIDPESGWLGITDFAQEQLGDVVFVELPEPGDTIKAEDSFMIVESMKSVSDIYAPQDATVDEVNDLLVDNPDKVNEDPYGDGRFVKLDFSADLDNLMDADEYAEFLEDH